MAKILCVDDEPTALAVIRAALEAAGHQGVSVSNVDAAMNVLIRGGVDLVISDYRMPGATGLDLLERMREREITVPLIIATGFGSIEHAVAAIKAGAVDYLVKPIRGPQLELVVKQALELTRLKRENQALREEVKHLRGERQLIGESIVMTRLLERIRMVAPTRATVLVQGESGTGKELVARTIHELSDRGEGPFISINCAALPESLIESTLFGHEKGAFTGALRQVKGAFERAHRGTLLLDEISEMRLDLQAKLLRVLQEQEFERVGGTDAIRVDVRVIATTNRNLQDESRAGRFREDLFYRLTVVPIAVPPLRERPEDIAMLAQHFATRAAAETAKEITGIAPAAVELLQRYGWPGNVRELAHAVERAVILSPPGVLETTAFDLEVPGTATAIAAAPAPAPGANGIVTLVSYDIAEAERILIERALLATNQNRTRAAELLGISVRTLRNKLNSP